MSVLTRSYRRIYSFAAQRWVKFYTRKRRSFVYRDLRLEIPRGVFHPGFYRSTLVFAEWLLQQDLRDKKVLELGSGSGLLSIIAAKAGAVVTAVDINPAAVLNTSENAARNNAAVTVMESDLFSSLDDHRFDMVLINPPYFAGSAASDAEKAWFCGEDHEYFKSLFAQMQARRGSELYCFILSDRCNIEQIAALARLQGFEFGERVFMKQIGGEALSVFLLTANDKTTLLSV